MAGYRETFGANVDYAYGRGVNDIGSRIQRGVSEVTGMTSALGNFRNQARQTRNSIKEMNESIKDLDNQRLQAVFAGNAQAAQRFADQIEKSKRKLGEMKKQMLQIPFTAMEKGLGGITKGLIGMNAGILGIGFDFLISSIKRVYELQERWTKAIGGFNMKLGGMTAGLRGAQKAATAWSSTIRGLTNGDINEGIEMFAEFTMAIGRVIKQGDGFSKFGLQVARGFNLGGGGAGQLSKVMSSIGMSSDEATESMKVLIKSSNAAGVPTNMLAKDVLDASTYMARFGKEGQKTFIQGAAYARKYTISIEQLKASVEGLDMFDEAARTASKLNTTFGTMINSMDLMMEDDPAKRLEMIRQQFLAQGLTFDKLTPKQRRYLSESLKLTDDQTAALLSSAKAGETYADFQEKAAKREKNELSAKKMMEKQLRATAQTMYAFGMAFDRITVAIANAIKPLLEVLGLASKGGKEFKSFGQVMESITKTVEEFFNSLAGNSKWNNFMKTLAVDMQKAGSALKEFVFSGGAADLVGKLAGQMKNFYTWIRDAGIAASRYLNPLIDVFISLSGHLKEMAIAWVALKGFNLLGGANGFAGSMVGKGAKKIGAAGVAAGALGGIAGGMIGGTGAGIGGALGGVVGSLMGPLGQALGPIVGALAGKAVEWLLGDTRSGMDKARDDLRKTIERETNIRQGLESLLEASRSRQEAADKVRESQNKILFSLDENLKKQKGESVTLNSFEAEMFRQRAKELTMFGKNTKVSADMLMKLEDGSKLTKDQLASLVSGSRLYEEELSKLRKVTQAQADLELAKLQSGQLGQQKNALEAVTKLRESELKLGRQRLSDMGGSAREDVIGSNVSAAGIYGLAGKDADRLIKEAQSGTIKVSAKQLERLKAEAALDKLEMTNIKDQKRLAELQTDYMRESIGIQLRQNLMSSAEFMNFSQSAGQVGRSLDDRLRAFLMTPDAKALVGNDEALNLIRGGPNLGGLVGKVSSPSQDIRPVPMRTQPMMNYAAQGPVMTGGGSVVHQTNITLTLDGAPLARSTTKTLLKN